jgi:uncharacterized membrane protein
LDDLSVDATVHAEIHSIRAPVLPIIYLIQSYNSIIPG